MDKLVYETKLVGRLNQSEVDEDGLEDLKWPSLERFQGIRKQKEVKV